MTHPHLNPEELEQVRWAYAHLEQPSFAARLSHVIGTPIEQTLKLLPKTWHRALNRAVEASIRTAGDYAVRSLGSPTPSLPSHDRWHRAAAFGAGAVGGLLGPAALLAELPLMTVLMLRGIADIARSEGEDLAQAEARLACLEVFALGGRSNEDDAADTGYYGIRATLGLHFVGLIDYRAAASRGIPPGVEWVRGLATRFGLVVEEPLALKLVPLIGAACSGLLNLVFMQHFQDVARGHFILRRLERKYGMESVRAAYAAIDRNQQSLRSFSPLEGW